MATDINIEAAKATIKTSKANNVSVDVIQTNFVSGTTLTAEPFCSGASTGTDSDMCRLFAQQSVDVLIFNPPYVPTPDDEILQVTLENSESPDINFIANAWAGGEDGRVVIDQFLPLLPTILANNDHSRCYLVLVDENKPKQIARILASKYQLDSDIIKSVRATNEMLHIMKITRSKPEVS